MSIPSEVQAATDKISSRSLQDLIENFLQEFVGFTSYERARLDLYKIVIGAKRESLQEIMP